METVFYVLALMCLIFITTLMVVGIYILLNIRSDISIAENKIDNIQFMLSLKFKEKSKNNDN